MKTFYTTCFARRKGDWSKCYSIAVYPPKYYSYGGRFYPDLAADPENLHSLLRGQMDEDHYYELYEQKLATLNPVDVVADLPDGAILLCHEKPGDPCHRHKAAEWLNKSGLCTVEEIYNEKDIKKLGLEAPNSLSGLFY